MCKFKISQPSTTPEPQNVYSKNSLLKKILFIFFKIKQPLACQLIQKSSVASSPDTNSYTKSLPRLIDGLHFRNCTQRGGHPSKKMELIRPKILLRYHRKRCNPTQPSPFKRKSLSKYAQSVFAMLWYMYSRCIININRC